MKQYLFYILFSFIFYSATAQQSISGKVQDKNSGKPLVGASITVSATQLGTVTDESGRFSLEVPTGSDSIYVSMVGYKFSRLALPKKSRDLTIALATENQALREVVVTGYETNRPLAETAGAIGLLNARDINRFSPATLVPALNTLPGVRMEERATGSYRISIRGSSLRAPFGVRNVKMYLNEVPLIEANSTIPVNLLDASTIGRIEVIKGPAGSVYGAGTGGTILLETARPKAGETSVDVGSLTGSFGLRRYSAAVSSATEKSGILVRYEKQKLEGYRAQSAMDRDVLLLSGQLFPSNKQVLSFHTYYSNLFYELPGGLTRAQYEANPRQARDLNVTNNSHIKLDAINIGIGHQYQFNENWSNTTSIFGVFSFFNNPFTADYERNTNQAYGGRTKTTYTTNLGNIASRFTLGAELSRSFTNSRRYQNNQGLPGRLNLDDEIVRQQGFIFAQAEADLPGNFIATLGASVNSLRYELNRLTDAVTSNIAIRNYNLDPQISPRVGLVKVFSPQVSAHASISTGYSAPTDAEVRPSNAGFNAGLKPENGINYETGVRGNLFSQKLVYDLVAFQFNLKETIVSRTIPFGNAGGTTTVFNNAGNTSQKGIETALSYAFIQAPLQTVSLLKLWSAYTYSHFRFLNYKQNDQDFSGNRLTGTPNHVLTAGLDAESRHGLYLNVTSNYTSEVPLNDANTFYADPFFIIGARGGIRKQLWQQWQTDLYAGIDNAFDKRYSLGNDLNAFGNRFFQAAPGRNLFFGLQLKYLIKAK
ncbi:TonB-dependent receptor [Adhaeribacter aquaticus]|uniref:TonB-dependent receptor n=1 Tax=Adhaeribacter aquaticus TaxID=299567 RepID=UPI0004085C8E|nr:TonB-dependent receptor [Adhaeribacter aquaticus]